MKIVILATLDVLPWQFRSEFIATLIHNGHEVIVVSAKGLYVERLKAIGAEHVSIPLKRFISPVTDFLYVFRLFFALRRIRPDIVYTMTTKPNNVGPFIAKLTGVPRVCSLYGGIGYIFVPGGSFVKRLIKAFARVLLRTGMRFADYTVFQNNEDQQVFFDSKLTDESRSVVVGGSGVNLREFNPDTVAPETIRQFREESGLEQNGVLVLLVARVTKSKGVLQFLEASKSFSDRQGCIRFILVGPLEVGSLDAISEDQIQETPLFKYVGFRTDIKEIMTASDIVVLPSYHREGIPNSLLEAMALNKPIVTTNNVGCREVVDDGVNGLMIPIRDASALATAIRKLADDSSLRESMGRAGREKVEREYEVKAVNKKILEEAFLMKDIIIPDFYTEESNGKLTIYCDGDRTTVDVTIIPNDFTMT